MKKVLAVVLALALALAMSACQGTGGATASPATQTTAPDTTATAASTETAAETKAPEAAKEALPPSSPVTLTIWQTFSNKLIDTMNQNPIVPVIEQKTGVKLNYVHPSGSSAADYATAFQLLLASKNYPDIMRLDPEANAGSTLIYPGGGEKGISDGVIVKLNDLVAKYAPNYQAVRAWGGTYAKDTVTDDGTMWAMYTMNLTALPVMQGLAYRKDWTDKLGLSAPVTIDDWHTMLTAFKEKMGAKAPLVLEKNGTFLNSEFLSAYGVGNEFYQVDGKVLYGYIQPGFKEYLTTMSKWYSEGLLDANFTTNADIMDIMPANLMADGTTGAGVTNWIFAYDGTYTIFKASKDPNINFPPVNNPVLKAGDTTHLRSQWSAIYNPWIVTTACKNPEVAVSLLDWCYDKDTSVMLNYGQLDTTYKMVDGKPQFTDVILADPKGNDKPTMWGSVTWENGPGLLDFSKAFQGMPANLLSTSETWSKTDNAYSLPVLSLTADEASLKAKTMADINTYVNETIPQFIMGAMSMDKFDSYVSQIQSMGIDKVTAAEQAALDRYNKR